MFLYDFLMQHYFGQQGPYLTLFTQIGTTQELTILNMVGSCFSSGNTRIRDVEIPCLTCPTCSQVRNFYLLVLGQL